MSKRATSRGGAPGAMPRWATISTSSSSSGRRGESNKASGSGPREGFCLVLARYDLDRLGGERADSRAIGEDAREIQWIRSSHAHRRAGRRPPHRAKEIDCFGPRELLARKSRNE